MSKYGDVMEIINKKILISRKNPEGKDIMSEFQSYFDYKRPNYKNIHQIIVSNRDLFEEVSQQILIQYNLNNQITACQMMECILKNLHLFAFTVLYMANSQYSEIMDTIKKDLLQSNNEN